MTRVSLSVVLGCLACGCYNNASSCSNRAPQVVVAFIHSPQANAGLRFEIKPVGKVTIVEIPSMRTSEMRIDEERRGHIYALALRALDLKSGVYSQRDGVREGAELHILYDDAERRFSLVPQAGNATGLQHSDLLSQLFARISGICSW